MTHWQTLGAMFVPPKHDNDNKMPIAYRIGRQAKEVGLPITDNPFHAIDHLDAWKLWRAGWKIGKKKE